MRIHTATVLQLTENPYEYIPVSDSSYDYDGPLELADRSAAAAAGKAAEVASNVAQGYGSTAAGIGSTLVPTLAQEATNPTGFTPTQLNNQLVAGEQGAGGATSGITGTAGLNAMRTRNSGALSSVFDAAARRQGQTLSQNALNVQNQNAMLQQKKQQEGLSGLEGLYGTDVGAQLEAMGIIPKDIEAQVDADKTGWVQNALAAGELGVKAYAAS